MPQYPKYNPAMECLARLRSEPHGTAISDLATDLDLSEDEMKKLLIQIEAQGFKVKRWYEGSKWVAAIAMDDYDRAARMTAAYIDLREDAATT